MRRFALIATPLLFGLAACGTAPRSSDDAEPPRTKPSAKAPSRPPAVTLKKGGGFYKDDGPADEIPANLDDIPDAEPRWEPLHRPAMRPYFVLGKEYFPNSTVVPYRARGLASWYGRKFHGQKTSIGEPYDMFAMTAAHTTLALPSYVRVTNVRNGKSVVVRVTDRGPFHADRIIDLSYTAAYKLGLVANGSGEVEVEAIIPGGSPTVAVAAGAETSRRERDDLADLIQRLERTETPSATAPRGNVYLQLGAFANAENAENLKNRLALDLDWAAESLTIFAGGGIHRLQLGPYSNRGEAERVADRIRQNLGYKPTLVAR